MTVIKINAITVPPDGGDELARRFAARAGAVDNQDGFEGFELLRPTDGRATWLVVTRWRDEESFEAWRTSPAFGHGHRQSAPGAGSGAAAGEHGAGAHGADAHGADAHGDSPHGAAAHGARPHSVPARGAGDEQRPVAVSSELWSFEISGGSAG